MRMSELKKIVDDMEQKGIKPVMRFSAKSGEDYGYVLVFKFKESEYIIKYGNSEGAFYEITDDPRDLTDLAYWAEMLGNTNNVAHIANVRGADFIKPATESDKGPFKILRTRYWRNGTETNSLVSDEDVEPIEFSSYKEAQEWISKESSKACFLAPFEERRPSYKIIN